MKSNTGPRSDDKSKPSGALLAKWQEYRGDVQGVSTPAELACTAAAFSAGAIAAAGSVKQGLPIDLVMGQALAILMHEAPKAFKEELKRNAERN